MLASAPGSSPTDVVAALERRVASSGSAPLVTYYDVTSGERTELSGTTFANWVDKSVNLLSSMDIDEEPNVHNTLLLSHPGHWVGLIWTIATWQYGGSICVTPADHTPSARTLDAAIIGPEKPRPAPGVETIACSLHPLGFGFAQRPTGVTDYAEVLSQPDVHWRVPHPGGLAVTGDHEVTWDDINSVRPRRERGLFSTTHDTWQMIRDGLIAPILGGGSSVFVAGADETQLHNLAVQERAQIIQAG